jgi:hypothetical protein
LTDIVADVAARYTAGNGWKIPARNTMNVIAIGTQGCSGAVVEYLLPNLKVKGSYPPCAQILFRYTAGKFRGAENSTENHAHMPKTFFCSMYESSLRHPVWVPEIKVKLRG